MKQNLGKRSGSLNPDAPTKIKVTQNVNRFLIHKMIFFKGK